MPLPKEQRPGGKTEALQMSLDGDTAIVPTRTLHHPKAVAPAYAVLVMRRDGRWTRQLYISLHSAQKAMDRAAERGVEARCQLVEIVPVPYSPLVVVGRGADE